MKNVRILKYVLAAIGVFASVAFYIYDRGLPEGNGYTAFSEEETVLGEEAEVLSGGVADGYVESPEAQNETFSAEQELKIDEIVREAVREELKSICDEGYLEAALYEAASLSAAEYKEKEGMVNINTASLSELTSLNGIGESRAADIISYRESSGGFNSIEEIMNVSGIGEATFEKFKDKIYV